MLFPVLTEFAPMAETFSGKVFVPALIDIPAPAVEPKIDIALFLMFGWVFLVVLDLREVLVALSHCLFFGIASTHAVAEMDE